MATYDVTAQTRRVQFTGDGTAGPFAFSFQVNLSSDIKVYVDSTVKTETTHYTVSINSSTGAGTVSFTTGNEPTSSQTITILGSIPLARTSKYTSGGQLTSASLEDDFDTNMFIHQQTNEEIDRSLRLAEHDVISGADMTLPVKATRAGKVLGFNSSTGNPEVTQQVTDATVTVNTLSAGASATASVSVSNGTVAFTLGIPTGATGATGPAGSDGADGADGEMTSFNVAGTSGSNQTITNGNTLTIAGGDGITTTASSTDTVTIAVTADPIAFAIGLG